MGTITTTITIAGIIVITTIIITTITTCTDQIYTDRRTAQLLEPSAGRPTQRRYRTGDYRKIHKRSDDPFYPRRLVLD
jgi:hypothetical protein